jgi:predicted permease
MFTVITLITLTVGVGANTVVFSVLEGVLLKPLPYTRAEELAGVWLTAPGIHLQETDLSPSDYFIFREQGRTFQDIGLYAGDSVSVTGIAQPEQVAALLVTDGTLPLLGVQPILGRPFTRQDDSPGTPETAMLTYGYWRRTFGGDASAVGRTLVVDGTARQIIGVLPSQFHFLDWEDPALLMPFRFDRGKTHLGNFSYQGIARLKPGVTIAQLNADIARMLPIVMSSFSPPPGFSMQLFEQAGIAPNARPLKQDVIGDIGKVLWVLMGSIGVVLLIACANVANLLLVRVEGRKQELALRAALGAGGGRIAGELLLESVILGVLGGAFGLGLAYATLRVLRAIAPSGLPRIREIGIDGPVLLFTLLAALLASLLVCCVPIFKYAGTRLTTGIREGARGVSQSREQHRARGVLVVVQVALALVLLICSGLMIRTFRALTRVNPGFTGPAELQAFRISIPDTQVKEPERVVRMEEQVLHNIESIPGVSSVGIGTVIPMSGGGWHDPIFVEGHTYAGGQLPPLSRFKFISPGFIATLGIPLIAGRDLTWADTYNKVPVALVSENVAREYWRDPSEALGKRIRVSTKDDWRENRWRRRGRSRRRCESEARHLRVLASYHEPLRIRRCFGTTRRGLGHAHLARRFGELSEECPGGGLVGESQSPTRRRPHAAVLLRQISCPDLLYADHARRCGGHGAATRYRGHLRRDRLFGVAADPGDWHSHGPWRTAAKTNAHVRESRIIVDWHRCSLRPSRGCRIHAAALVPAFQREAS